MLGCWVGGVNQAGRGTSLRCGLRSLYLWLFSGFSEWWWKCSGSARWTRTPGRRRSFLWKRIFMAVKHGKQQQQQHSSISNERKIILRSAICSSWEVQQKSLAQHWSPNQLLTRKCTQVPTGLLGGLAVATSLYWCCSRSVTSQLLFHAVVDCCNVGWKGRFNNNN